MILEQPSIPPSEAPPPLPETGEPGRRPRRVGIAIAVAAAVVLALWLASRPSARAKSAAAAQKASAASRAIPVATVPARIGDIGVYIDGLGTVTALNTVAVHTRVDGQLLEVDFHEGQMVARGELLARLDPRPFEVQLTQAEGQRGKDEAALENARVDLKRYETLAAQDAIPRQQLDTQAALVRQDEAAVKSDQGQIDAARLNLTYTRIEAPIAGQVGLRLVDQGNIVHVTDANGLVVLTQVQPIAVVFTIPADQLAPVLAARRGGTALAVEAWDRDRKAKLATGDLIAIDNQIDPTTGTVKLKAQYPNRDGALFANQFVNARLLVNTIRQATLVPAAAVQRSTQATYVWIVQADSTVAMRPVQVLVTEGEVAAVRGAVPSGTPLVIDGVDRLQPGSHVAAASSGAAGGASKPAAVP